VAECDDLLSSCPTITPKTHQTPSVSSDTRHSVTLTANRAISTVKCFDVSTLLSSDKITKIKKQSCENL